MEEATKTQPSPNLTASRIPHRMTSDGSPMSSNPEYSPLRGVPYDSLDQVRDLSPAA